jgi:hypothetical protein
VFEGRPVAGLGMNLAYGGVFLGMGLLLLVGAYDEFAEALWLLSFCAVLLGLGLLLIILALAGLSGRSIEVDDDGVRFKNGSQVRWEVTWDEVTGLETESIGGRYPFAGFTIATDAGTHLVTHQHELGPEPVLVRAFRTIASEVAHRGVPVVDRLGWASDLEFPRGRAPEELPPDDASLLGTWHTGARQLPFLPLSVVASVAASVGFAVLVLQGLRGGTFLLVAGLMPAVVGGTSAVALFWAEGRFASALRLREGGLDLRFQSGRTVPLTWREIERCGFRPQTGLLLVRLERRKWYSIRVKSEVGQAVARRFAAAS